MNVIKIDELAARTGGTLKEVADATHAREFVQSVRLLIETVRLAAVYISEPNKTMRECLLDAASLTEDLMR